MKITKEAQDAMRAADLDQREKHAQVLAQRTQNRDSKRQKAQEDRARIVALRDAASMAEVGLRDALSHHESVNRAVSKTERERAEQKFLRCKKELAAADNKLRLLREQLVGEAAAASRSALASCDAAYAELGELNRLAETVPASALADLQSAWEAYQAAWTKVSRGHRKREQDRPLKRAARDVLGA